MFWKNLKGPKQLPRQACIYDILNGNRHITSDKTKIRDNIKYYWNTLGKMNMALGKTVDDRNIYCDHILHELHVIRDSDKNDSHHLNDNSPVIDSIEITQDDVEKAITQCQNGKSCGPDDIPNEFLKKGGKNLVQSLTYLFNALKNLNKIPNEWKQGIVIPIHN